jgi:hypothetical protein
VESGVGYVKKNFLHGIELTDFSTIQAAAQVWLDTIANVRIHGETQQRPVDLLAQERPHLGPLNPHPYDIAHTSTSIASSQFRITVDTNQYSVPSAYAHRRLTVKAWPDRVCIYFDNQLIARHQRRYGRHEDIEEARRRPAFLVGQFGELLHISLTAGRRRSVSSSSRRAASVASVVFMPGLHHIGPGAGEPRRVRHRRRAARARRRYPGWRYGRA